MARPGFVLDVDERTPPLVVPDGESVRLERLPLGTSVIYPADSLPAVPDVREAIEHALDQPSDSPPLAERLSAGTRLTIVFDDLTTPVPRMRTPDVRGQIVEAVLTRAAAAGVDDLALVAGRGLNRRMTSTELQGVLGERVFRSFVADGLLTSHDAEDPDLAVLGRTEAGDVAVNGRVAASDLVVYVHLVTTPLERPGARFAAGISSTATVGQLSDLGGPDRADEVAALIGSAVPVFQIDAVLDHNAFPSGVDFLSRREWEWSIRDQLTWLGVRRGLALTPRSTRRRLLGAVAAPYAPTLISAGAPAAVQAASRAQATAQHVVPVSGQADVGVIGVGHPTPYSIDSLTNPVLAAWSGLVDRFGATTGRPFVREGGALILYHPMSPDFSPLHHPAYVDFFDALTATTDPAELRADVEPKFATDPWYRHLYRTSLAVHGLHPLHRWYEIAAARAGLGDVVWVGADRSSVERLGFRAASTLADALEIVADRVGRSPAISYLHTPPHVVVDGA